MTTPDKCPKCGATPFVTDHRRQCVEFKCGTEIDFSGALKVQSELCEARAEADQYRQQHEALRAAVEDVADLLRGAAEKARQLHFIDRDPYDDGRSVGFGTAVKWLRKALADHGGDDADGCVDAEVADDV